MKPNRMQRLFYFFVNDLTVLVLLIAALIAFVLLSGCGGSYTYIKTAEGCEITVKSTRELQASALNIGPDCEVNSDTQMYEQQKVMWEVIVDALRGSS